MRTLAIGVLALSLAAGTSFGAVQFYGDEDLCNTGTYPTDPTLGAAQIGLSPGVTNIATTAYFHTYAFSPAAGDYPGMDQIYVGSVQAGFHDGYSNAAQRTNGPQVLTFDYSALVPAGQAVDTFTLGLGTDDFQFPPNHQPYSALINGVLDSTLTSLLNSLDETGPTTRYVSIGLSSAQLSPSKILTLTIDQGGDGGDGWAMDYASIGITTVAVPEPATLGVLMAGTFLTLLHRRRK